MDFKFSKGTGDAGQQDAPGEKTNQSALLVLLLLLVGGFSYLYFFTGLIKPQQAPQPVESPAPQVVKMPLPAPDSAGAGAEKNDAATKSEPAAAKEAPKAVVAKPAQPATAAQAVAVPAAKPSPPVKPKEEPKKPEPPKAAEKKVQPAAVADKKDKKPTVAIVDEKKPAAAKSQLPTVKKAEPVKPAGKSQAAEVTPKPKKAAAVAVGTAKAAPVQAASGGSWSVLVGQYVIEEALSADMGRVRKAGLEPVVKAGSRKKSAMNRLLLAEFANRGDAQAELARLKRHTSDAFIMDQAGKFAVYAGSYLLDARASSEKERLAAAGFKVSIKRAEIAIPTQSLTVGPFKDKKTAEVALGKLKTTGVKAALVNN
ncbi:MAG: SPOR domain-containing protein [Pseudomonadota bacterium]